MPPQIQLKTVKMVEIEPESAVPAVLQRVVRPTPGGQQVGVDVLKKREKDEERRRETAGEMETTSERARDTRVSERVRERHTHAHTGK